MSEAFWIAIFGSAAKIGLEATAILLETAGKPDATIADAAKACREAATKTLQQFKDEAK
jgi:hypothetical protein